MEGWRLQLGIVRNLQTDGLPGGVVPVRDDDFLLSDPAGIRREHTRLRLQPGAGQQRRVDGLGDRGVLLGRRVCLIPRHEGRGRPGQRWPDHRHPDPGRPARHPGCGLPRPGQSVRRSDDRGKLLPRVGRAGQPGADREQLPVLQRHGDERGARVLPEGPAQGVPEVDVPGHGTRTADLHPAGAGDQLDRPGR